jgi:hypothetical protein
MTVPLGSTPQAEHLNRLPKDCRQAMPRVAVAASDERGEFAVGNGTVQHLETAVGMLPLHARLVGQFIS